MYDFGYNESQVSILKVSKRGEIRRRTLETGWNSFGMGNSLDFEYSDKIDKILSRYPEPIHPRPE
jgi:hypothetical protein